LIPPGAFCGSRRKDEAAIPARGLSVMVALLRVGLQLSRVGGRPLNKAEKMS